MVTMVPNAKLALNQFRNAQGRPDVRLISVGHWALQEIPDQTPLLSARQPRWPTRYRLGLKCSLAATSKSITPSHRRTGVAADATGDLVQRTSLLEERYGA